MICYGDPCIVLPSSFLVESGYVGVVESVEVVMASSDSLSRVFLRLFCNKPCGTSRQFSAFLFIKSE